MNHVIQETVIEVSINETNQQKANRLLKNIIKLKRLKKEAKKELEEELSNNANYFEAKEQLDITKKALKFAKLAAMNTDKPAKIINEIEELKIEIKNDSELLNDFLANAYQKNEQMRLFAEDYEYYSIPNFKVQKR